MDNVAMRNRVTIALLTLGIAAAAAAAADKSAKQKPLKEKPAAIEKASKKSSKRETSNASIATQQKTAKALDKKVNQATTHPSEDIQAAIDDINAAIRSEFTRHDAALTQLNVAEEAAVQSGKQKEITKARKALHGESTVHERTLASLNKKRESLMKKLDPPADTLAGKKAKRP